MGNTQKEKKKKTEKEDEEEREMIEPSIPEFDETFPKLTQVLKDFSKLVPEA